jgi:hypothetical protein
MRRVRSKLERLCCTIKQDKTKQKRTKIMNFLKFILELASGICIHRYTRILDVQATVKETVTDEYSILYCSKCHKLKLEKNT